jgi:glycosyltransferase involved in cell wall biosynthesis
MSSPGLRLRILLVHNRYKYPGGEDSVVSTEAAVLRSHGHEVEEYLETNDTINISSSPLNAISDLFWSGQTWRRLGEVIQRFRPDIVHCHNTYYRISPSAYWRAHRSGVPVIQTLHNYRLACANASLTRNDQPCELCLTSRAGALYGVRYACFQNSRLKTLALTASVRSHWLAGTYSRAIAKYICVSRFSMAKQIQSGLPASKLVVKPNCVFPDPGMGTGDGQFVLCVGRLSVDKGIRVLLEAAAQLPLPVRIVGNGPAEAEVRAAAAGNPKIRFDGLMPRSAVLDLMQSARLLIFPSLLYENCPMTIAEAFSTGLPVVASRLGAAAEMIRDGVTGALFEPLSATDLVRTTAALCGDPSGLAKMRLAARAEFEQYYSAEATYRQLMSIYSDALSTQPSASANVSMRHGVNDPVHADTNPER